MSARMKVTDLVKLSPLTGRGAGGHTSHATGVRVQVNVFGSACTRRRVAGLAVVALAVLLAGNAQAGDAEWIAAWGMAPLRSPIAPNVELPRPPINPAIHGQSVRQVITVGADGSQVRLHFDNRYGKTPVTIGRITLARVAPGHGEAIDASSLVGVTASGTATMTLPATGSLDTDAVPFAVHAGERIAISLYVPGSVEPASWHVDSRYAQAISAPGDHTRDARWPGAAHAPGYDWMSRVDVVPTKRAPVVVALGDSITNGFRASAGASYSERLAARLDHAGCGSAVINTGIDGNQVANAHGDFGQGDSMLQRLPSDVLSVPGARYLLLLGGINDIGEPTMAAHASGQPQPEAKALAGPVIDALARIATEARQHGLRVYGATLPPFGGTEGAFTPEGEAARQAINAWIRRNAPYDAVIDFDATLRDSAHAERMQPRYDSGDHIHPNDAGYEAMAGAVPLALFGCLAGGVADNGAHASASAVPTVSTRSAGP